MTLTEGLERTFDTAASNYENFRPGNPPQLPLYFDTGKIQELPFLQAGNSRTFPAVNSTRHALVQQFLNTHTLSTRYLRHCRVVPDKAGQTLVSQRYHRIAVEISPSPRTPMNRLLS